MRTVAAPDRSSQQLQNASISEIFLQLDSSPQGLASEQARDRLAEHGPNELLERRKDSAPGELAQYLTNPLVIILLLASIIAAATGEVANATIIVAIVLLSTALNFVQTRRSQIAVRQLQRSVALTATILRDGSWQEMDRRVLVPGDVIRLSAGDLVPADAVLFTGHDVHVQQAALTGESLPVPKGARRDPPGADEPSGSMVYLGTSVISGTGEAVVIATGRDTMFGDIAARLATRAPETEFDRGIKRFSFLIMRTVILLVLFVFAVSIAARHDPLESLLFAIALAVGLTPEFLPMITTVTLGQGAMHMAKQKVIVKHLSAIQNFGSMDTLCSDKTGTLTLGEMTLSKRLDPLGHMSDRAFALAYLNSQFETGIRSPLDTAILREQAPQFVTSSPWTKLDEIPFDFERRRLSIAVGDPTQRLLITKGAPENVLPICEAYEVSDGIMAFSADTQSRVLALFNELSAEGYRVLAVAYRKLDPQPAYGLDSERDLVFAGLLAFYDPPLPDAADALAALRADGVDVKILSGDNELVVGHVCAQVGIASSAIVLGSQLDRTSDAALARLAESATIFARVSPAQKNRILLALKSAGHVVGFLGDGVNDAPSLHTADVGISVSGATDIARDTAEIILLERSLRVLHNGIIEGRKAFGNVMKYLLMGTSSNFGNMFSMAGASVFLPFLPMLPTQVLLNNFLYDLSQVTIPTDTVDETFIRKPQHWNVSLIRNFMVFIGPISSIYDFFTFYVLLTVFHASETLFHTGWFVESLATQTLVLFVIRTAANPLHSRPSRPLTATIIGVAMIGLVLPVTPLAGPLGFTPLPWQFYFVLAAMTITYLILVEIAKRRLMRQ